VDCLFGFTGRQFDQATGLQNNLNRWYDPQAGRWTSEDPEEYEAGDSNLYRYCSNAPVNQTDPSGLWSWDGDWLQMGVGGLLGVYGSYVASEGWSATGHGAAMIGNAATFHQIDSLNSHVDNLVQPNGGLYAWANASAHVGVYAGYAVAGAWVWGALELPTIGIGVSGTSAENLHFLYQVTAGGESVLFNGVTGGLIVGAGSDATAGMWMTLEGIPIFFPAAAMSLQYTWLKEFPASARCFRPSLRDGRVARLALDGRM
jgi:RHS repeat-associated protein